MATGIDFGTTNSVIAQWNGTAAEPLPLDGDHIDADWFYPSFENLFPTVAGQGALQRGLLYGWEAKLRSQRTIEACKRMLRSDGAIEVGARRFPATSVAAGVFAAIRDRADDYFAPFDSAVITVPANAKGGARYRTRAAAAAAGIKVKALLNEPTAAALAYMHHLGENGTIMVFDWGGGTIDVTVLEHVDGFFHEKISHGITQLGGIEIDQRLRRMVLGRLNRLPDFAPEQERAFALAIERSKIRLSVEESVHVDVPGRPAVEIGRSELEAEIADLVEQALIPARRCLNDLGAEPAEIDDILMIGGSSRIPCVRQAVERLMDDATVSPDLCDPMTAVAEGAAVAAALFDRETEGVLKVTSMYALGTTHQPHGRDGAKEFSTLIKAGSPLPASREKHYTPNGATVQSVDIPVWEADPAKPLSDEENFQLTTLRVAFPRELPRGEAEFTLKYVYTTDGLLRVTATLVSTGEVLLDEEISDFTSGGCLPTHLIEEHLRELALTPPLRAAVRPAEPVFKAPVPVPVPKPPASRPATDTAAPEITALAVDGSNLAWGNGFQSRGDRPSLARLQSALRALAKEFPQARVTAFVDPAFQHQIDASERPAFEEAIAADALVRVPAGTHGKADRAVIEYAERTGATIVTNDNYGEFHQGFPWLVEKGRVLGAQYAGDIWLFLARTPRPSGGPRRTSQRLPHG
ncbi:Hsp70 family protein [Actinomadura parmotrematis]|uniref:Hsp70 family protein n=1 Tax=Actinomadura parmotrematis TaxID=2864039 RepID=A0ABS7FU63_9ACTN|nr:Hsp70 family protein [Actinomadura parmotrematis]MBW8483949.1 Hsp70 family protein [Actinomadura parmotrematis]